MDDGFKVAVVHLVRCGNENAAVADFVDSYLEYPAGHAHRLIFLLKGFAVEIPEDLSVILDRVQHSRLHCPEGGHDIGSYVFAAERLTEPVVMFLNSFSILLSDAWLSKLVRAHHLPRVGLVGASGSWESLASTQLAVGDRNAGSTRMFGWVFRLRARLLGVPLLTLFPAFPNPHVRSNGFMMARQTFLALRPPRVRFKGQAWLFESGRASLTRRVLRRGERCVVVGCDGVAYDVEEWPTSQTFWQGGQENLLVGDNRTSAYAKADAGRQRVLSRAAWQRR